MAVETVVVVLSGFVVVVVVVEGNIFDVIILTCVKKVGVLLSEGLA